MAAEGRPRGSKNLNTDLLEELEELITVREGGKIQRVTKQRAMVKALAAKGMKGDVRALAQIANMRRLIDEAAANATPKTWVDLMRFAAESRDSENDRETPPEGAA